MLNCFFVHNFLLCKHGQQDIIAGVQLVLLFHLPLSRSQPAEQCISQPNGISQPCAWAFWMIHATFLTQNERKPCLANVYGQHWHFLLWNRNDFPGEPARLVLLVKDSRKLKQNFGKRSSRHRCYYTAYLTYMGENDIFFVLMCYC